MNVGAIDPRPAGLHVIQDAGWSNGSVNLNVTGKQIRGFYSLGAAGLEYLLSRWYAFNEDSGLKAIGSENAFNSSPIWISTHMLHVLFFTRSSPPRPTRARSVCRFPRKQLADESIDLKSQLTWS